MRMSTLRGGNLPDGNVEGCCGLGSRLYTKRCIRAGVDPDGRRAPGRLFLGNIVEDHLVTVRRRVEDVLHLVDAETALVRIVAGRCDHGDMMVVVWKALVLVRGLPGTDISKVTVASAPGLDKMREVLE